jgi:hypothetical protein
MGLIAGPLSSISSRWAIAWPFAVWKVTAKGLILKRKKKSASKVWRWKCCRPHVFVGEHDKIGATSDIHWSGVSFITSWQAGSSFPDSSSAATRSFQLMSATTLRMRRSTSWRSMHSLLAVLIDIGSLKLALRSILNSSKLHSLASGGIGTFSLIVRWKGR